MLEDVCYTELQEIKIFLNYIDFYQNNAIVQYLLHNESTEELGLRFNISGTIYNHDSNEISEIKAQITKCIFKTVDNYIDHIIENEYIVYDINSDPTEIIEIEKVLEELQKLYENDVENKLPSKYFILLSTPLTWGTTISRNNEGILYESEYRRRRAHPSYMRQKNLERIINLFEEKVRNKVRTLIICCGHCFGGKNDIFHYIFKLAFFNKKVPIVEPGHQIIPLIYINDLVRIVGKVIKDFPPIGKKYIFAIQPNFWKIKTFSREIVSAIAGNATKACILSKNCLLKYGDDIFPQRVIDAITTSLKLEAGYLKGFQYTFIRPEDIGKRLADEYRTERNLLPIKILIDGPPLSGKTVIAKELAEYYNLYYIDTSQSIQIIMSRLQKDINTANKLLLNLEKEKTKFANDDNREAQQLEENVRTLREEWQKFLKDLINHVSNEKKCKIDILKYQIRCLKKIVSSKLCSKNQGYILDGFPFTYNQASQIFFGSNCNEEEKGKENNLELEKNPHKKLESNSTMPNFVIFLNASEKVVLQRGMQLPLAEVVQKGYDKEGICKRLDEFKQRNEHNHLSITKFFYDYNPIPLHITINEYSKYCTLVEMMKDKIGSPHTYLLTPFEISKKKNAEINKKKMAEKEFQIKQLNVMAKMQADYEGKFQQWTNNFEILKREEELAVEAKTLPIRQYLAKFVIPTLTQGILEVTRIKPEDPAGFLAEFLFENNSSGHLLSDKLTDEMKKVLLDKEK